MAALVTLDEVKNRLRIDFNDDDVDVLSMAEEATDIVIGYIKQPDHEWTLETVPFRIKAAILLVVSRLYEDRSGSEEVLTDAVKRILHRDRDPALA